MLITPAIRAATLVLSLIVTLLPILAYANNNNIDISNTPDWVTPYSSDQNTPYPEAEVQNGIHYSLIDVQVRARKNSSTEVFQHYAEQIVNLNGVEENSQINISFDPNYQSVQLHSLKLIRAGTSIDKINSAEMKMLQRENEMDNLIYNGQLTLNIILDDVRVGDTLEYSFTRTGANPVYQGIFSFHHYLSWAVPIGQLRLRIQWEKPSQLHYQLDNSDLKIQQRKTSYGTEYLIASDNIASVQRDKNTPDWFEPWGFVSFSETQNWEDVARWGMDLYQDAWQSNDDIDTLIANIQAKSDNPTDQISAALRFVQDEIRYLGIELGENSHKPSPAFETFKRRYGDCKDKTVLLITLLNKLGLKAYPALVNTEKSHTLANSLPSTQAFDHVITYLKYNDQSWWLDPTRTYQHGSISHIHQPDFGKALILRPGTSSLTDMSPALSHYGILTKDTFILNSDLTQPTHYTTSTLYRGWNAERQRDRLASKGLAKLQSEYLEFFQYYYPDIESTKAIQIEDDSTTNTIELSEYYSVKNVWADNPEQKKHTAEFYPNAVSSYLSIPDEVQRKHPLYITYPHRLEQIIEIQLPNDDWDFNNEDFLEENDFFTFGNNIQFNPEKRLLTLQYYYQSNTENIPPQRYQEYISALKKTDDYLSYGIYQNYENEMPEEELDFTQYLTYNNIIAGYIALFILAVVLWRVDQWRNPFQGQALYYPVSLIKFMAMWVLTLGFYSMYWFYKNFKYIKQQNQDSSMPVARGIFYYIWYYSLWKDLKKDNQQRFDEMHLPNQAVATVLAVLFFFSVLLMNQDLYFIPAIVLSCALALPLANYILFINQNNTDAIRHNSRWRIRHYLIALLSIPILVLTIGSEVGFLPNAAVIEGKRLLKYDIKKMQRNGVINPGDNILYFYSDSFLFIQEDGNGITQRHVFSYWKEDDTLFTELAEYNDIADINVNKATSNNENTTVTITRKDGSDFVLYLSNTDHTDDRFIKELKRRWEAASQFDVQREM